MKSKSPLLFRLLIGFALLASCTGLRADDPNTILVFPGANSRETYFSLHNISAAQAISRGKGVKVGILDHSFGTELHSALYAGGHNFTADSDEFLTRREWHGFWMALVLREIAPETQIYALNTYSFVDPKSRAMAMAKAIDWAIENKLDVLTYSAAALKGEERTILDAALDRAHRAGIMTVFIHTGHPGNILPSGMWSGLEDGREPDVNVLHYDYSVVFIEDYRKSQAGDKNVMPPFFSVSSTAPVVGGVAALMKSLRPGLTPAQCRQILRETGHPLEFEGEKPLRVLDALAALQRVQNMQ